MNMRNHYPLLFIATIMLACGMLFSDATKESSTPVLPITHQTAQAQTCQKHIMVVFVHGTLFPLPSRTGITKYFTTFFDHKKNIFQEYMDASRMGGLYQYQPIGEYGLKAIAPDAPCSIGCHWAVKTCNYVFDLVDDYAHTPVSFYTFGWSGALSQASRLYYGKQMYQDLTKQIDAVVAQKNITRENLEVIVMAHSHGGNVALNMATYDDGVQGPLIDQLILIGTPIQEETQGFVSSPLFKAVYSFYSESDAIQVLDIISTKGTSQHRFSGVLDKKLTQIEVTIGQKNPMHNEFWFFKGYKNILYRSSLDIQPLPFFVFIPFVLQKKVFDGIGSAHDLCLKLDHHDDLFEIVLRERKQDYPIKTVKVSTIPENYLHVPEMTQACKNC